LVVRERPPPPIVTLRLWETEIRITEFRFLSRNVTIRKGGDRL
jgi:hypothetical protein